MPHLNGSLTNIFTVINVFRDIIPLRVFSHAFFTRFPAPLFPLRPRYTLLVQSLA